MTKRLNVLVQAYACNPLQGSEEGVGWGWVSAIASHHDLHVLTASYHREDIESYLATRPELARNLRFHYVGPRFWHYRPTPAWRKIENSIFKPIMHFCYQAWQKDAYRLALELSDEHSFDLAHVITYVGFRFPGRYWKLPIPLVWGPIGGLENTPWRYFPALGIKGCIKFAGRNVLNLLDKVLRPGPKRAFRKAEGGIISATSAVREEIRRWYGVDSVVRCEIGAVDLLQPIQIGKREMGEPLRIVWSGLHSPAKALPILLRALSALPDEVQWQLEVLGDGPMTVTWQGLASSLGLNRNILWTGRISRTGAIHRLAQSHVIVVTSLHDLTSSVIIEALSVAVPVICPNHFGFQDAIDESCGIKVSVVSLSDISDGICRAIQTLHDDEQYRQGLARGALQRSTHFSWKTTGDLVSQIYEGQVG